MPEEKKILTLKGFEKVMNERLHEIEAKLLTLEIPKKDIANEESIIEKKNTVKIESNYPVPTDYIEAVNTLLNSRFGIKVEPFSDRPEFQFTIIVPREYSPLSDEQWGVAKGDLRSRVLSYADGINGVRQWIQMVYNNFTPEMRARIKVEM